MLTRRSAITFGIGPAVLLCRRAWGFSPGEFWNDKQPSDWSDKDIDRLLNKSPWAKEVQVQFSGEGRGGREGMGGGRRGGGMGGGGIGGGGMGTPGGGMGGPGGGMGSPGGVGGGMGRAGGMGGGGWGGPGGQDDSGRPMGGGRMPEFRATVRWESALPVIAASKKEPAAEFESNYVISVSGMPMMGGGPGRPPDEGSGSQTREDRRKMMEERLLESTTLQAKGKDPIAPDKIQTVGSNNATVLFLFPRGAHPLSLDDKEATFASRMGPAELKVKFNLKDMVYRGKLAL